MEENKKQKFSVAIKSESYQKLINSTLTNKEEAGRFIANISTAVSANPKLNECDTGSVVAAGLQANALNLHIGGQLGQAYLVPYQTKNGLYCQFQIGYKGLIQLAIRSGLYEVLGARAVHKGEYKGQNEWGEDTFNFNHDFDNEEIIGFFAYFKLLNGFKKSLFLTKEETEKHGEKYSTSYKYDKKSGYSSSLWSNEFETMGIKTVLKLLLTRYGVMSVELQKAIQADQAVIKDDKYIYIDNQKEEKSKITNSLKSNDNGEISEEDKGLSEKGL